MNAVRLGAVLLVSLVIVSCTGGSAGRIEPPLSRGSPQPSPTPARCPARFPDESDLRPPKHLSGIYRNVVPGSPITMTLCFHALKSTGGTESSAAIVSGEELRHVVALLDSTSRVPKGPTSCPADLGPIALLRFVYSDDARLDVFVDFGGCRFATNGAAGWYTTPKILRELDRLARGRAINQ